MWKSNHAGRHLGNNLPHTSKKTTIVSLHLNNQSDVMIILSLPTTPLSTLKNCTILSYCICSAMHPTWNALQLLASKLLWRFNLLVFLRKCYIFLYPTGTKLAEFVGIYEQSLCFDFHFLLLPNSLIRVKSQMALRYFKEQ